jgi:hypothetical protein
LEQISKAMETINEVGLQTTEGTRQVEGEVRRLQDLSCVLEDFLGAQGANSRASVLAPSAS